MTTRRWHPRRWPAVAAAWLARSRRVAARGVDRVVQQWSKIIRLTAAAVLAFVAGQAIHPGPDLTGPLTALLVVQASLVQSLRSGLGRVAAVLLGVSVAIALSAWMGLTWWSLGAAIGTSLTLAYALRLGDHTLETPISAMLILGVSQHDVAAETRIVNTLVGAGVGMAFNLLVPPPVGASTARAAVRELADGAADALGRAGEELASGLSRARLDAWLRDVHAVLPLVGDAEATVRDAQERRRLNPRAMASRDPLPVLASAIGPLDRSVLAARQTLLALQSEAADPAEGDDPYREELRRAFSVVLVDMAACLRAFGHLVLAEADGREHEAEEALAETLEILRETRAILTELYLVDPGGPNSAWLLRGAVLGGVERLLSELDVEQRARARRQLLVEVGPRLEAPQVMTRLWLAAHTWAGRAGGAARRIRDDDAGPDGSGGAVG